MASFQKCWVVWNNYREFEAILFGDAVGEKLAVPTQGLKQADVVSEKRDVPQK